MSDPERRRREAERGAIEAVGRRLVALDQLLGVLNNRAARARVQGKEAYHEILDAHAKALAWAMPIVRAQVEVEVEAAIEREERRKRWGVHHLPDAMPIDPDHGRALAYARGLRAELAKMDVRLPPGDGSLAEVYGRLLDAVIAAVEEHALGFYRELVNAPPQMVLRNDGAMVLNTRAEEGR